MLSSKGGFYIFVFWRLYSIGGQCQLS